MVMKKMREMISMFLKDEEGATMVEYGIMVALIAAVSIVVISVVGGKVNNAFNEVKSAMGNAGM
ncbi:MAG: Flp family type IVb pilin [Desulfuromonas sp.]|nr:Flp family type IVb pilin [Desulfuromonas sp.]